MEEGSVVEDGSGKSISLMGSTATIIKSDGVFGLLTLNCWSALSC